jgi:Flp pilus assembly protein CpaB
VENARDAERLVTTAAEATRTTRRGWRDPRIVVGVAIMAVSLLLGAWLLARADDTVTALAVRRDLPAGARIGAGDLEVVHVRLDADLATRYVASRDELPRQPVLSRPVDGGELLARGALAAGPSDPGVEVPLSVATDDLPATVRPGSVVDVWVVPDTSHGAPSGGRARSVLQGVTVLAVASPGDSLAPEGTRQVIVTVPGSASGELPRALGRAASGRLVLTRRG